MLSQSEQPTSSQPGEFPGYAPLTEPEAVVIAKLTENRNFSRVNAIHTPGYKHWFIQQYRRSGFTPELGLGTIPSQ